MYTTYTYHSALIYLTILSGLRCKKALPPAPGGGLRGVGDVLGGGGGGGGGGGSHKRSHH